jgi:Glycosyl transferase family 11
MPHHVTVLLNGGLGNQMFQYAAARALSLRNGARLYLDRRSGFAFDLVYKRQYELGVFPIEASLAGLPQQIPFWIEAARGTVGGSSTSAINNRIYGCSLQETQPVFLPEVAAHRVNANTWMWGFWQSERYFSDVADSISRELTPPAPHKREFLECAQLMETCTSVAVGVRIFEEVPGESKKAVGGLTPLRFFNDAAAQLAGRIHTPVFFVFCTTRAPQLRQLNLPGEVHVITHENGFEGSVARLWLLTRCRHHIIANSSFFWWGAWLREARCPDSHVIASPLFSNRDTIPTRWTSLVSA